MPYTDVKIITQEDGKFKECSVDEIGEISISNPGVFAGKTYTEDDKNKDLYYKEKYLRTGDLGRKDSDGFVWITGRAKDLIIREDTISTLLSSKKHFLGMMLLLSQVR